MLENILSYGIQVRGVMNVADIVSYSFDHYITGWQDQLVGSDLGGQMQTSAIIRSPRDG